VLNSEKREKYEKYTRVKFIEIYNYLSDKTYYIRGLQIIYIISTGEYKFRGVLIICYTGSNFAEISGVRKPESLGCRVVLFALLSRFDTIPA